MEVVHGYEESRQEEGCEEAGEEEVTLADKKKTERPGISRAVLLCGLPRGTGVARV
jgi:hypothetical protein